MSAVRLKALCRAQHHHSCCISGQWTVQKLLSCNDSIFASLTLQTREHRASALQRSRTSLWYSYTNSNGGRSFQAERPFYAATKNNQLSCPAGPWQHIAYDYSMWRVHVLIMQTLSARGTAWCSCRSGPFLHLTCTTCTSCVGSFQFVADPHRHGKEASLLAKLHYGPIRSPDGGH